MGMKMKICFLEGDMSRRGGTERMTAFLSGELSKDNDVYVLSLSMNGDVFFPLSQDVEHSCLKSGGIMSKIRQIHGFIKKNAVDVVINVDTGMGYFGILAARGTGAKTITWEHANFYNNWGSAVFPYIRSFAAKRSDSMVVLTQKDKENYEKNIRGCAPVSVIPNPAARHEGEYNPDSRIILSAGLLNPIKRFELIPDIAKKVFLRYPDWKWVICGDGPVRGELEKKIRDYGLEKSVILKGTVADMGAEYRNAALFALTSEMEGLPMVLLEAKGYKLPIVSFDIMTGPSDIVRDGVNGFLAESGDTDKMGEKICELIENDGLRRDFSGAALLDMDKFDLQQVVSKWKTLLTQITKS